MEIIMGRFGSLGTVGGGEEVGAEVVGVGSWRETGFVN
jgi:hypothetical protein